MVTKFKKITKIFTIPVLLVFIAFNQGCSPTGLLATGGSSAMVVAEGER